ncbi:hypothetical protein [Streptomyces lavendulocolor]|uniref:hypothetical protein n=1 Tax=Streptomyces lavendulocolor TaxID=67316 RepID=UPI003C2AACFD
MTDEQAEAYGTFARRSRAPSWSGSRVLLPRVSVLARQVSEARTAAKRRLDDTVARATHRADPVLDEDVARLSLLKDRHINLLGRYVFNIKASGPGQGLRPFRDPGAVEGGEDEV